MKRTVKTISYTILILLITSITLAYFVFTSNLFQNWLTGKVTDYLSLKFKTKITIGHINYHPINSFSLDDVYFGDQKNDTLFYVENLKFNLGSFALDSLKLSLNDVRVKGGYCKMVTYPDKTFNIDVLFNILDPNDTIVNPKAPKFTLYFDKVVATNTRFKLIDSTKIFEKEGFDGFNEDYYNINIIANHFWIIKDSLNLDIIKLSCKEKSGVELKNISAQTIISPRGMYLTNLETQTKYTHIKSKQYSMIYNSWDELADYNNRVKMVADIDDAEIDMRDIAYFAPTLKNYKQVIKVNGKMSGPTKNMKFKNLNIFFGNVSYFKGNIELKGLPNIEETFIDVKAVDAITTRTDLEYLLGNILPDELSRLGKMEFTGRYTGFYNDFVAFGKFNTKLGKLNTDLNMKLTSKTSNSSYSGNLELIDFDLGTLVGQKKYIGRTTLKTAIKGKGFESKNLQTSFTSKIKYFHAKGYNYKNIAINGNLNKKMFEGDLNINDSNVKLDFKGTIDLRSNVAKYKFNAVVKNANLQALKFDTVDNIFSTKVDIDFAFKDLDNNDGTILIDDILFVKSGIDYPLKQIKVTSKSDGVSRQLKAKSEIFDAEIKGNYVFVDLADNINNILYALMPNYFIPIKKILREENFSYKIAIANSDWISDLFYPNARVYDMSLEGKMSSNKNDISANAFVSVLKYKQVTLKNITLKSSINNGIDGSILIGVDELLQKDTSILKDFAMLTSLKKNEANNHIKISDSTSRVYADILTDINFLPHQIKLSFEESNITYRKKTFYIKDNSFVIYNDSQLLCKNVKVMQEQSYMLINGFYDFNDAHNLRADVKDIDLSLVNLFLPKLSFQIGGDMDGSFVLKGNNHKNYLNTFVNLNALSFDKDTIGDFSLTSNYNEKQERFLVYTKSLNGKLKNFEAGGFISTANDKQINIDVTLNESDVKSFQAFLKEQVYFYGGLVSSKCKISGTTDKILLNGQFDLGNLDLRVEYLKTRYKFNTHIDFDNEAINIKPFNIIDEQGKTGLVSGGITHKNFDNMKFDISISKLNKFHLLNTTEKDNSLFYGSAFGSGSVRLTGYQNLLLLETDLKTEKGTVIYIPLSTSGGSDEQSFINYINKDTSVKVFVNKQNVLSGFLLSSMIQITPDAEIQLIVNEQTGDIIKGKGIGTVKLELNKQGAFNMYGQVIIEEGEYRFTAAKIFSKKFTLTRGGTIDWTGDPMQARMDIQGMYYVRKTSITELVPSAATGTTIDSQVPVECLLYVKGSLTSPEIKFDINFPDLQSSIGTNASEIQNVVRQLRADPDMMNQQVMSLMLFGKFVPISSYNSSSASNLQSGAASTLSGILTSQANSLMGNIIPGLDFNIDYQAATDATKSRAIFSASKKFYDNRFELQTSYDPQIPNNANVTGQYSLRKDGNIKAKVYSRNTVDPIYNRNALTQGVGLYYRKEFETFSELFSKKKQIK